MTTIEEFKKNLKVINQEEKCMNSMGVIDFLFGGKQQNFRIWS